jgi:hypothetical protein
MLNDPQEYVSFPKEKNHEFPKQQEYVILIDGQFKQIKDHVDTLEHTVKYLPHQLIKESKFDLFVER